METPGLVTVIIQSVAGASGNIIAAIITTVGTIIAAIIATMGAKRIVKESMNSRFRTYGDKSHDVTDILVLAQNDVFFVAAVGDIFIKEYFEYIKKLLSRGIKVRYLLLTKDKLEKELYYVNGRKIDVDFREKVIESLNELKLQHRDLFEWREFDFFMTESYVCVDIMLNPPNPKYISSSVIQTMLYQYKTPTEESPITYISPKTDEKEFLTTVQCIKQMWVDSNRN